MKSKILILVALFVTSLSFSQRNPNNDYLTSKMFHTQDHHELLQLYDQKFLLDISLTSRHIEDNIDSLNDVKHMQKISSKTVQMIFL